jgi:hypothetical protein
LIEPNPDGPGFEALLPGPEIRTCMSLDRETIMQIALSTAAVLLFIAGAVFVGTSYRMNGSLSQEGGVVLVAIIGAFVVLMLGAGLWLERQDF